MALKPGDKTNFDLLVKAAKNGDLGLIECKDAKTGEYRAVLAAMVTDIAGNTMVTPFGHLFLDDPYEEYSDPTTDEAVKAAP